MRDTLLKNLEKAANELYENLDKKAHIQDVVRRLETASEDYPLDFVIRNMEDIFRKRAQKSPQHLVTAEEFEAIRQDLWGLNPRSPVKEYFSDLVYAKAKDEKQDIQRVYADESVRNFTGSQKDLVEEGRNLVLKELKTAGVGYAQTRFAKGLYSAYDAEGNPIDGVLMFSANVITKSGESTLTIPVILDQSSLMPPDTFACDTMRYPLSKKGISDFSLGINGLATDKEIEHSYIYGESEVRDLPTIDNSAQELLNTAKEKVFYAFREAGINNCQIKFGSFEANDDGAILKFDVALPFSPTRLQVPVQIENTMVYSPFTFSTSSGAEFELSKEGVSRFVSDDNHNEKISIAQRIEGDATSRIPQSHESESYRSLISTKLAQDLKKMGAVNPQIYFVTSSENSTGMTAAFIGTFASAKGDCHIAVPIKIEGRSVKTPEHFFGEDEKPYNFSPNGLKAYIDAKSHEGTTKSGFYGNQENVTLAKEDIDRNNKKVNRQNYDSKSRPIVAVADDFTQMVASIRGSLVNDLIQLGAVNPQVQYQKRESKETGAMLKFTASFSTKFGTKNAVIPVIVEEAGVLRPNRFLGQDNKAYDFNKRGLADYLEASVSPETKEEEEITSKLGILSFDRLRTLVKEALASGDHRQVTAGMASISERFGEEAAKNCFSDLLFNAQQKLETYASQCGGCPFFRSKNDPQSRTAEDSCLKFQTRVAGVQFGGHHSKCQLVKRASEKHFDGVIVESQIKLT